MKVTRVFILSSIVLRGLSGEKTYIVIPSKLSITQLKTVTTYADKLKARLDSCFLIPVKIVKDTSVTSAIAKENLIVLGNQDNNTLLRSTKTGIPVKKNKTMVNFRSYSLPTKNLNLMYIVKNPNASKKLMFVLYWTNKFVPNDIFDDFSGDDIINYQYIIDCGNNKTIKGK